MGFHCYHDGNVVYGLQLVIATGDDKPVVKSPFSEKLKNLDVVNPVNKLIQFDSPPEGHLPGIIRKT